MPAGRSLATLADAGTGRAQATAVLHRQQLGSEGLIKGRGLEPVALQKPCIIGVSAKPADLPQTIEVPENLPKQTVVRLLNLDHR
jgi:hypothetical protein